MFVAVAVCGVGSTANRLSAAQSTEHPVGAREAAAQALFDDARQLLAAGDLPRACQQFEASQRMDPGAGTELNLADCYQRRGMLASAWMTFRAAGADSRRANRPEWAAVADERAAAIESRVPRVVLHLAGRPAKPPLSPEIALDGQAIGTEFLGSKIPLDPGAHSVAVSAAGYISFTAPFTLAAGEERTVEIPELALAPTPQAPSAVPPVAESSAAPVPRSADPRVALGLGAGGLALVGMGVGTYFGLTSLARNSDAANACPDPAKCPSAAGPTLANEAKTARTEAIVSFSAGGALAVASGVLLGLAAAHKDKVAVLPVAAIAPDGWLVGAFGDF